MNTVEAANGRWREILSEIGGIDAKVLDGKHHPCPSNGKGTDRFRFADRNGDGTFFCACAVGGNGMDLLKCCTGREFADLAREVDTMTGRDRGRIEPRRESYAERLFRTAIKSPRSAYLASRGLEVAPGLLFARGVDYRNSDGEIVSKHDAMLAPFTRAGKFITLHVTYLTRGRKASVESPRKILPGQSMTGGGVELYPAEPAMGVAEGVETAIAAKMIHGMPVHAALNTALLAKWQPPSIAKRIVVFADHDTNAAGHAAAWALCHRLRMLGIECDVTMPEQPDTDWNDVLLARSAAA